MDGSIIRDGVEELRASIAKKNKEIRECNAGITALYSLCEHQWHERGYDPRGSGTTYYICIKCGAEKRE